jgi:hypothetical protein
VHINDEVGYGVVATAFIPVGTITYVKDDMEVVLDANHRLHSDARYQHLINKFSYTEADGTKVLSWDIAKYINHSCHYNTLSTGYGFEIAIRDIHAGEQITDDYGMFNIESEMHCLCGADGCRQVIGSNEFIVNCAEWDSQVRQALSRLESVPQPLLDYLDAVTLADLKSYLVNDQHYRPVSSLQFNLVHDVAV